MESRSEFVPMKEKQGKDHLVMIDAQQERSDTMAAVVPDESDHMTPEYFAARLPP